VVVEEEEEEEEERSFTKDRKRHARLAVLGSSSGLGQSAL